MNKCPVCNSNQNFVFSYQNFDYYRCKDCQLVSTYPLPTKEVINNHYIAKFKKGNYELAREYAQPYKLVYLEFINILKKNLQSRGATLEGKRVLDIGCYTGIFLELLQEEGADVYGLELQKEAVKIANEKLPGKVIQADVSSYNFPLKKYDIITLLGIVEHVPDPILLIKNAYKLLKKGGIIFIQTPNSSSFLAKIAGKYWPPYSPIEHIHLFSEKSLQLALTINGFDNVSSQMSWKKLPVGYVYNNFNTFGPEFYKILKPLGLLLNKSSLVLPFYGGEMVMFALKE